MKIKDSHTHTNHSYDGKETPEKMILSAIHAGADYIAVTDHEDLYLRYCPRFEKLASRGYGQIDKERHFAELLPLKEKYADKISVAIGAEFGFAFEAVPEYREISKLPLDVIINSVHSSGHVDIYYSEYYDGKEKNAVYTGYLQEVLESTKVDYAWDILGHLGYIERKSPYADKRLKYADFADLLDEILKTLAEKGKALELNTHTKETGFLYAPELDILKRYKELGGEFVTYGSDAHTAERIGEKFEVCIDVLKTAGFKYLTTYLNHTPTQHKI